VDNHRIKIFDVGGQRNEQKKWIFQFETVSGVIFVAALTGLDAVYVSIIFCFFNCFFFQFKKNQFFCYFSV